MFIGRFIWRLKKFELIILSFSTQSMRPPRACYQSAVIPIENVVKFSWGPISSALWLVYRNSVRHSVMPPDEHSPEPSWGGKGSSKASHEPSLESIYHLKVHMKLQMNLFLHIKVHVKVQNRLQVRVHEGWAPTSAFPFVFSFAPATPSPPTTGNMPFRLYLLFLLLLLFLPPLITIISSSVSCFSCYSFSSCIFCFSCYSFSSYQPKIAFPHLSPVSLATPSPPTPDTTDK